MGLGVFLSTVYNHLPFNNSIKLRGKGNVLEIKGSYLKRCVISVQGDNNTIIFDTAGCNYLVECTIRIFGNNNCVRIEGDKNLLTEAEIWMEDNDNEFIMGGRNAICGKTHIAITEGKKIEFGDDNLLSAQITLRTGDSHSILAADTGQRINPGESIAIANHVWIGNGATLLKGVRIGNDCVIGTNAVVTKSPDETNVILGGNPARIIKRNIMWDEKRI